MKSYSNDPFQPLAVSVSDACAMLGISRSEIYRLMAAGRIPALKHGVRTLIPTDALLAHLATLPAANIGTAPLREPTR